MALTINPTTGKLDVVIKDHTKLKNIGTTSHSAIDTALTRLENTSGTNTGDQTITITGDATGSGTGAITLAVNKTRLNVRNETGTTIASTKAVYVSGFNNLPLITLADNTAEIAHNVVGITVAPITHQADGFIAVSGQCDAETNAWTVGTELYLTTSGALTSTAPTSGAVRHVAIVTVKANYPTGKLLIYQYPEENYLTGGTGTDIIIRAGDDAGANKISFRNYSNTEVASINSIGSTLIKPSANATTTFQVQPSGSTTPVIDIDTTNSRVGILTATPSNTLSLASEATRTIQVERRTTNDTAGNTLVLQAGGATSGATDKAGGTLQLNAGISTGTGTSQILLRTYTPSTTGTTDNTLVTRATINNSGLSVSGILTVTPTAATTGTVLTLTGTSPVANGTVMNVVTTLSGSGILTGMAFRPSYSNVGTGATILGMDFGPAISSTTGTVANLYGMLFLPRLQNVSNVAVTNAYGMYIRLDNYSTNLGSAASVVTNWVGIQIAAPHEEVASTVTNKYAIYADPGAGTWVIGDGNNMSFGSTTGVSMGIATTEKLSFYGVTPIVQPANTTDLGTVLSNLGLRASGTAYPITTSGAVQLTGGVTITTGNLTITDKDIVLGTTTGTKIGTSTTQKLGFFNSTPIVKGTAFDQSAYTAASHTHAAVTQLAAPAGGTGATAGAYDTAANRNLMIASVNAARTDIANIKQVLNGLIDDLQALGLIA